MLTTQTFEGNSLSAFYEHDAEALSKVNQGIEAAIEAGKKLKKSQGELREYHVIHILNMWRLGRVLEQIAPHGGARFKGRNLDDTLLSMGIDKHLSARSRRIAAVDYEDLRHFIEESGDDINLSYLLRLQTESTTEPPAWDEEAEWRMVQSVLRDYLARGTDEDRLAKVSGWLEE